MRKKFPHEKIPEKVLKNLGRGAWARPSFLQKKKTLGGTLQQKKLKNKMIFFFTFGRPTFHHKNMCKFS
jgi:hypothetical protein